MLGGHPKCLPAINENQDFLDYINWIDDCHTQRVNYVDEAEIAIYDSKCTRHNIDENGRDYVSDFLKIITGEDIDNMSDEEVNTILDDIYEEAEKELASLRDSIYDKECRYSDSRLDGYWTGMDATDGGMIAAILLLEECAISSHDDEVFNRREK